jgi:Kip1 ubiquitination-promoting complex protein 1
VCVYKGKWMYEVTLGTAGIQQLGWAPIDCPFTNEEGVGDSPDSYAYDGKRIKKWNVSCANYGQPWTPGDVIGSCLDLDQGTLTFYRNGTSLGVAFPSVRYIYL